MSSNIPKARRILEDVIASHPYFLGTPRIQDALALMGRAKPVKTVRLGQQRRVITDEQKDMVRDLAAKGIYTNTEIAERALGHSSRSGRVTEILQEVG